MPTGPMLEDKVAVVTGIGPGMGRSIALALAREGADVILAARREERCNAVADEIRALGRVPLVVPTDIADPGQCDALVDTVLEQFGGVDIFVQNGHHPGDWSRGRRSRSRLVAHDHGDQLLRRAEAGAACRTRDGLAWRRPRRSS